MCVKMSVCAVKLIFLHHTQGRIQDFHLGGGGGGAQKIMCPHSHYERKAELTFGRGPGPA